MDGVLIDSHPVHRQAWREFLASVGKNVDDDQLQYILEGRRREEILRHFFGNLSDAILAEYGKQKDRFFHEKFKDVRLVPGVRALLDTLRSGDIKLGIATSASSYRTWRTLDLLQLNTTFAAVVTGDDVSVGKPDPAVYQLAARKMQLLPQNILVMEDAPCGVQAAKSAGMSCIGVSCNGVMRALIQAGADKVIPDFLDLSAEAVQQLWQSISNTTSRTAFA
jgi:beta-phosphoglucomutase